MSNSKKAWNASKALKRSADANKKMLKINLEREKQARKKIYEKGRIKNAS